MRVLEADDQIHVGEIDDDGDTVSRCVSLRQCVWLCVSLKISLFFLKDGEHDYCAVNKNGLRLSGPGFSRFSFRCSDLFMSDSTKSTGQPEPARFIPWHWRVVVYHNAIHSRDDLAPGVLISSPSKMANGHGHHPRIPISPPAGNVGKWLITTPSPNSWGKWLNFFQLIMKRI